MRLLFVVLVGLLVLIQYPLWLGQGSWSRVWRLDQSLALQREVNAGKRLRNEGKIDMNVLHRVQERLDTEEIRVIGPVELD